MRRTLLGALAVAALFLIPAGASHAQGHHGGGWGWGGGWHGGGTGIVVGGPGWSVGYGWGPGWYYPPPYYYGAGYYGYYGYPYPYGSPVVMQPAPQYIQQEPQASLPAGYWYYCASARGYYPTVPSCPEAWIQVPPAPQRERE